MTQVSGILYIKTTILQTTLKNTQIYDSNMMDFP